MESRKPAKPQFLVFHPDASARSRMRRSLEQQFGAGAATEAGSEAALLVLDLRMFDLIFIDDAEHIGPGSQLIEQIRQRCSVPVVLMCDPARASRQALKASTGKEADLELSAPAASAESPVTPRDVEPMNQAQISKSHWAELQRRVQQLLIKNSELKRSLLRVEEAAATDPLTGLANRRHFEAAITQRVSEALRCEQDLSCVMIDLDGYKQFNDSFGHPMGDRLLTIVGKVAAANLRAMDTAARYGGDEFVLLLPQSSATEAHHVASRISKAFAIASMALLRRSSGVTMSIGIASIRCAAVSSCEQLVGAADRALYVAKHAGRNRIVISEPVFT